MKIQNIALFTTYLILTPFFSYSQQVINITTQSTGLNFDDVNNSHQIIIDETSGSIIDGTNAINVQGSVLVNVDTTNFQNPTPSSPRTIISGNINLGTNENSSIRINDSGRINSNLTFGNANQRLILGNNESNRIIYTGQILGDGFVDVGFISELLLDGSFDLDASVNGMANLAPVNDLGNSPSSIVSFGMGSNININKTIGENIAIDVVLFGLNSTINLAEDANYNVDTTYMSNNSTINVNGGVINGDIVLFTTIQNQNRHNESVNNRVNFNKGLTLNGNINLDRNLNSVISITEGAILNLGNSSIEATTIILEEDSQLDIAQGSLNGNLQLAQGAGVNFSENDSSFNGNVSGSGDINLTGDTQFRLNSQTLTANINGAEDDNGRLIINENQTVLTNANIGANHSLRSITLENAANLNLATNNNSVFATSLVLNEDSSLNIGSGIVDSDIKAENDGDGVVSFSNGFLNQISTKNLGGNIGEAQKNIGAVNVGSYSTLRNGSYDINADFINFGDAFSKLEVGSGALNARINDNSADINFTESKTLLQNIDDSIILRISENKSLSNSNKTLNAYIITLDSNSVLNVDSGDFGSSSIVVVPNSNNTAINFNESRTLASYTQAPRNASIGSNSYKISNINIAAGKTINTDFVNIYADNINLAEGAILNSLDSRINANVNLAQNSQFNLNSQTNFNSSIDGVENNRGVLNVAGNRNLNFAIGENHALAQVNILAGANANFSRNIYANAVNVYGNANLNYAAQFNNLNVDGGVLNLSNLTHQVLGDLNLTNAATIISNIDGANNYGNITVGQNLTFSANSKIRLNINENLTLNDGDSFVIASAETLENQGIDYRNIFIGDVNTNILNDFRFDLDIANGELVLRAVNIENISTNLNNFNSDKRTLYELIFANNSNSNNNFSIYRNAILNAANSARANEILSQLEPQVDSAIHRVTFNDSINSLNIISSRINEVRGVASGGEAAKKSMWVQVLNSQITQDDDGRFTGYEASSNAIEIGFDGEIGQDSLLGLGFTYGNSTIDSSDNLKTTEVNSYQASLYASKGFDKFFVNGILGFVYNQYSSNRQLSLTNERVVADYDGQTYLAKIDIGSSFKSFYNTRISPVFSITAAQNQISNYQEKGATALNLQVENDSTNLLELRGGIDLSRKFLLSRKSVIFPSLKISYGHDFIGDEQRTTSNFVGQSNQFTSSSNAMPQGSLRANFDLEMLIADAFSLSASYGIDYRDSYEAQNFAGKIKYQF